MIEEMQYNEKELKEMAEKFDCEALELVTQGEDRAEAVYNDVMKKLG